MAHWGRGRQTCLPMLPSGHLVTLYKPLTCALTTICTGNLDACSGCQAVLIGGSDHDGDADRRGWGPRC